MKTRYLVRLNNEHGGNQSITVDTAATTEQLNVSLFSLQQAFAYASKRLEKRYAECHYDFNMSELEYERFKSKVKLK